MPVQHDPLKRALIAPTDRFLRRMCAFLQEKKAYANLIMDDKALLLISSYYTSQDLTELRVLTKELI